MRTNIPSFVELKFKLFNKRCYFDVFAISFIFLNARWYFSTHSRFSSAVIEHGQLVITSMFLRVHAQSVFGWLMGSYCSLYYIVYDGVINRHLSKHIKLEVMISE